MKWTSHIVGTVLAFVVAFTAQSAALARMMPDASGQMVICTGTGPVMVYLDDEGAPMAPPHICPEYALSLIVALDHIDVANAPSGAWKSQKAEHVAHTGPVLRLGTPRARGPPELI